MEAKIKEFGHWLQQSFKLPSKEVQQIYPAICSGKTAKNQHFFQQGEPLSRLYFLRSGIARNYYITREGKEFNKSFIKAGDVVTCISALFSSQPVTSFSAQALTGCEWVSVKYRELSQLSSNSLAWSRMEVALLQQLALKKQQREAELLLLSATERYQLFRQAFADVEQQIANYHIASYLGITDVALSRICRRLAQNPPKSINPG